MIVGSLENAHLLKLGLDPGDIPEVQAFGIWLRRTGKYEKGKKVYVDKFGYAYAIGQITAREYLLAIALERL